MCAIKDNDYGVMYVSMEMRLCMYVFFVGKGKTPKQARRLRVSEWGGGITAARDNE